MGDLINEYLKQCSEICNNGGYTLLESLSPAILRSFNDNGSGSSYEIIEIADRVLFEHLKDLMNDGVRIFSWQECDEVNLRKKLLIGCVC